MVRQSLEWSNVAYGDMSEEAKELFKALEFAKDEFEAYWQKKAPTGKKVVFSYRNGNGGLSVGMALANGAAKTNTGLPSWVR